MQSFTGKEYVMIDIANQWGLDKESWSDRLNWVRANNRNLELFVDQAEEPELYRKAVYALRDAEAGIPTGFIMGLDCTASGLQLLSVLIGCHKTAGNVNLLPTGKREDVYLKVANEMNNLHGTSVTRKSIKHPLMTTFYGSKNQPKELFGEDSKELTAFYEILSKELTGAMEVMDDIQSCWQPNSLEHSWTLPDGHRAVVKVMGAKDKRIEVDEFEHATFTFRHYVNEPSEYGLSLAANIVHSLDGFIVREIVRRSHSKGFDLVAIHDSFWTSPIHMQEVREMYVEILAELADMNILQSILREVTGNPDLIYTKHSDHLADQIKLSEYALS